MIGKKDLYKGGSRNFSEQSIFFNNMLTPFANTGLIY